MKVYVRTQELSRPLLGGTNCLITLYEGRGGSCTCVPSPSSQIVLNLREIVRKLLNAQKLWVVVGTIVETPTIFSSTSRFAFNIPTHRFETELKILPVLNILRNY